MQMDARVRTIQLSTEFIEKGDPLGWFEQLYATADGDPDTVPWAHLTPNPVLIEWLDGHQIQREGRSAIVVGCGLGDDAEELAKRGFRVTAFDISQTAIAWCQHRFPNSSVTYCVADLFAIPEAWQHNFEFVLESYTIQAMPPDVRAQAIPKIADLVAESGKLLVICRGREPEQPLTTVPFPLTQEELTGFKQAELNEINFEDFFDQENSPVRRFRVLYDR
jgi:ubiquinone/menaquinone biosynthesis C-methylase UbiE